MSNLNNKIENNTIVKTIKSPSSSTSSTSSNDSIIIDSDSPNKFLSPSAVVHSINDDVLADDETTTPSSSCSENTPKTITSQHSAAAATTTSITDHEKPSTNTRRLQRKTSSDLAATNRKRSTNNLLHHKTSRAYSDSHQDAYRKATANKFDTAAVDNNYIMKTSVSVRHLEPISSASFGLRKQLFLARRSPSPCRYNNFAINSPTMCPGYVQYQLSFLEVPLPKDYGDASSDDLSSEWDSDVPEPQRSPKVFFLHFLLIFFTHLSSYQ